MPPFRLGCDEPGNSLDVPLLVAHGPDIGVWRERIEAPFQGLKNQPRHDDRRVVVRKTSDFPELGTNHRDWKALNSHGTGVGVGLFHPSDGPRSWDRQGLARLLIQNGNGVWSKIQHVVYLVVLKIRYYASTVLGAIPIYSGRGML